MTARMMSRFPSTVTRYMDKNNPERIGWRSGSSEIPKRWNSETIVRFCCPTLISHLLKTKWLVHRKTMQRPLFLTQIFTRIHT
jgi:hypothetical protein